MAAVPQPGASVRLQRPDACVFIGGSAGAIEALAELLSRLPEDFGAPVMVALHVGMTGASVLPSILDRVGSLHAVSPADGESLVRGVVYVAPRGRHLLVEDGRVRLGQGPTEHGVRPAIDPLFRSAAREFGPHAIGVVLSGMLDDGTAGLGEIRAQGGWALVQQPSEAAFPNMPQSAIGNVDVDEVLPIAELAAAPRRTRAPSAVAAEPVRRRRHGPAGRPWPGGRRRRAAGNAHRHHLSGVRRRAVGGDRRPAHDVPLSGRACVLGRKPAGRAGGGSRHGDLAPDPDAARARCVAAPAGHPSLRPGPRALGTVLRGAG